MDLNTCPILEFLYGIDADVIDGYGSIDQPRGFDEKFYSELSKRCKNEPPPEVVPRDRENN